PRVNSFSDTDDVAPSADSPTVLDLVALCGLAGDSDFVAETSAEDSDHLFDGFAICHADRHPATGTTVLADLGNANDCPFAFVEPSSPGNLSFGRAVIVAFKHATNYTGARR